jgi:hypothetical protein
MSRMRRSARVLLLCSFASMSGCASLLGIEERNLDTRELTSEGYDGCEPENRTCDGCTSEWHTCVCRGWNSTPEAELRLECAVLAPEAIRADVEEAAQVEYDEYVEQQMMDDAGQTENGDDRPGQGDDDLASDDDLTEDDASSDDDVAEDDDLADDDTSDDDLADDDSSDDDLADDDVSMLQTFNEDYCEFPMPPGPCEGCFCGECREEIDTCLGERGCAEIMDCVLSHDCDPGVAMGAGSCYTQATCRGVMDEYGLGSDAFRVFQAALKCRGDSFCPCNGEPLGCTPDEGCTDCLGCWDACGCDMNGLEMCRAECGDPNCNTGDGCNGCTDCVDRCLCDGASSIGFCVQQCGMSGNACSPANDCDCADCLSECICSGQDEAACEEECVTGVNLACSPVDECQNCSTCEGACSCESGGPVSECLGSCESPYGCTVAGDCTTCGSCTAQCECETGDAFDCIDRCAGVTCTDADLSVCESCACTSCPSAFALCAETVGCSELMRCIETTHCLNLGDCSRAETCEALVLAVEPAALGIVESLAECRTSSPCGCIAGPAMIQCGEQMCAAYQPPPPDPIAQPCCGGDGTVCGLEPMQLFGPNAQVDCVELGQPGTLDLDCPSIAPPQLPYDNTTLPGCCRPDGVCGYQDDITGLGCIDATLLTDAPALSCQQ